MDIFNVRKGRLDTFKDKDGVDNYIVGNDTKGLRISGSIKDDIISIDALSKDFRVTVSGRNVTLTNRDKEASDIKTIKFSVQSGSSAKLQFIDGALTVKETGTAKKAVITIGDVKVTKPVNLSSSVFQRKVDEADSFDPLANGSSGVSNTFTLTTDIDNLSGTSGNDTFIGDGDSISAGDTINGSGGADTALLYISGNEQLNSTNVEVFKIGLSNNATFNMASISGATEVYTDGSGTSDLTLSNVKSNVILGANSTTGNADNDLRANYAAAALKTTDETLTLAVDGAGSSAVNFEFDVNSADSTKGAFSTLVVNTSGTKSYIQVDNQTNDNTLALKTLKVIGTGEIEIADAHGQLTDVTTVDLSGSTKGVQVDLSTSGNAEATKVTGGSGDDVIIYDANQFLTTDSVNGGDGIDAIITGDADFTSSTSTLVKALNATTSVEAAGSYVTAGNGVAVNMSVLTKQNVFVVAQDLRPANNAANANGDIALTITGIESGDSFKIMGDITGGTSAVGDSSGGDAINATALLNAGSDTLTLLFAQEANTLITGGDSQDDTGNGGKVSGDGLDASTMEVINITTSTSADDVTFRAGVADGTDTAGSDVLVGANATIVIKGAGDVDLGTVVAAAGAAADDLTIDGSAMTGVLIVTTGAGNDVIKGGSKADDIDAGTGTNVVTLGGGADTFWANEGAAVAACDTITDFQAGLGGDVIRGISLNFEALTNAELSTVAAEATLAAAVDQALASATDSYWTVFAYAGKTYAVYDTNNTFDTTNGYIVKLTGVNVADVVASNFGA